jgi:large subunit ribosomal protein L18
MKLDKRRRQECKTNYKKRISLLKSKSFRLIVRKTNRYIILQIIKSKDAKDLVMFSTNSKELLKYGWPENMKNSLKSLTAAYMAGYLLGKRSNIKEGVILDSGIYPSTKGSRVYAAVKGISDSGIKINFDKKIIPTEDRIKGKNLKEDFSATFDKIIQKLK